MRQMRFGFVNDFKKEFGGSLLVGKRKSARVLSTKHPIHLVLKSAELRLFLPGNRTLERLIFEHAANCRIKIHRLSLNWTHAHMILMIPTRTAYKKFIRACTAALAMAFKKVSKQILAKVFTLRPFTRVLEWGRDYQNVMEYHDLNDLEARGYIHRTKKKKSVYKKRAPE